MAIKAGRSVTFTLTLDSGEAGIPIPLDASVTARVMAADGLTALSDPLTVLSNEVGADWARGLVVVELSAIHTALITPPQCSLLITVTHDGNPRTWLTYIDVASLLPETTALFERDAAVMRFRTDRLPAVQSYLTDGVSDDYIWEKIKAAEAEASHSLRVLLRPTTVFAGDPSPGDIAALAGAPYLVEPAYDFDPMLWQGDRWGFLVTRQKPIIAVANVEFSWPGSGSVFAMPANWIRCDRKYGHVQFVPSGSLQTMPLSTYMMQTLGGGRVMPQTIALRYTAGLTNAAQDYPDLVDLVQRMASLRILQDAMLGSSGSISADGLSQSVSPPDLDKMATGMDLALERIRDRIHGIRLAFA